MVEGSRISVQRRVHVLLIEDDPGDAFLVRELLHSDQTGDPAQGGFEVVWASTVAEARQVAVQGIDCALIDLGLPDASGLEALHQVLAAWPDAAVVVLTGLADRELALQAVAAGAQDYLIKDEVKAGLLDRTLRLALERRRVERAAVALAESNLRQQHNRQVAQGLLPRLRVHDPRLVLATRYVPGSRGEVLGGDFLDAVELADGTIRAIIGDVSGHGPDEAALGVSLRIAWRALTLAGVESPAGLACLADMVVTDLDRPELFATATDLTLSADRATLTLRHAGHPAPLLVSRDGVTALDGHRSPALGVTPDLVATEVTVELPEHWQLLLFTDGLIEGMAGPAGRERWGSDGLAAYVAQLPPKAPEALADDVLAEAIQRNGAPLADDVALLVIAIGARPPGRYPDPLDA